MSLGGSRRAVSLVRQPGGDDSRGGRRVTVPGPIDPEVMRGFCAGDEAAFSEIYRRVSGPMFTVSLAIAGCRDLAADAVQQAFIQAWRAAGSYSADTDMTPWLFSITRRASIDLWRRERRHLLAGRIGLWTRLSLVPPWKPRGRPGRCGRPLTS